MGKDGRIRECPHPNGIYQSNWKVLRVTSGISDIWVESEVFGETTAENIIKGKLWN